MNILLISPKMDNPNGGIAVWTDMYLGVAEDFGLDCSLVNTAAIGARAKNGSAGRNFFDEFIRTNKIFSELNRCLKATKFDAVHLNTSCGTFGIIRDFLIAKRIKKVQPDAKIVVHYHCDIPVQIRNKISKYYLGKLLKLADENLVLCTNSKNYLEKEFSTPSLIVPNPIGEGMIRENEKETCEELARAFFVGRVEVAKGVREIYSLATRHSDITFELAGAVSDDVAKWEKPDNVILLGPMPHDDVIKKMDEADVFIFPSHSEGFSIALLESMARGLPAIATDVGSNKDMLDGGCGFIVDKGDVDAMSEAISTLASREARAKCSTASISKVKEQYTKAVVMTMYRESYKK